MRIHLDIKVLVCTGFDTLPLHCLSGSPQTIHLPTPMAFQTAYDIS